MFTAYQLAQKINTEYPNSGFEMHTGVDETTRLEQGMIDYINSALMRASRYIMLENEYEFPTVAGQRMYELPLDCEVGNVIEVTREVGPHLVRRCDFARETDFIGGFRYFYGFGNTIVLTPTPCKDNEKVMVFYRHTPMLINSGDDPIEVKDKYIDLIVYAVCSDMASSGSNPDIELANNFTLKYNTLYNEAMLDRYSDQPFYPKTKDNKRPPLGVLRRG